MIVAAGPISDRSLLFGFLYPSSAALVGAGVTALVVVAAVIDKGDWLTTVWRSGLVFVVAVVILVGQFAAADLELAHAATSGSDQCFVVNSAGSGDLTSHDALYFTVGTLTTTGSGSVSPLSDGCRAVVTWQVVIGAFVLLIGVGGVLWRIMQHPQNRPESYESGLALTYLRQGDRRRRFGDRESAEERYRKAHTGFEALVEVEPTNRTYRNDLRVVCNRLADAARERGDIVEAEGFAQEAVETAEKDARANRWDTCAQVDLAEAYERVGSIAAQQDDALSAGKRYQEAVAVRDALARRDPANQARRRELAATYVNYLGDLYLTEHDPVRAEHYYRAALGIAEDLTAADPTNEGDQRDLAVVYGRLGTARLNLNDSEEAETFYRKALTVREALAGARPSNQDTQRDLLFSYVNELGNLLLELGKADEAETLYRKALATIQGVVDKDPGNTAARRDLWVAQERLGAAMLVDEHAPDAENVLASALALAEALAAADPSAQARRDLALSYQRLGDVMRQEENDAEAESYYREEVSIREALLELDSSDVQARRELANSYRRLGDVLEERGHAADAETAAQRAEAIEAEIANSSERGSAAFHTPVDGSTMAEEQVEAAPGMGGEMSAPAEELAATNLDRTESRWDVAVGLLSAGTVVAVVVGLILLGLAH